MAPQLSTTEWIEAHADKYDDRESLIAACIRKTSKHRDTVVRAVRKVGVFSDQPVKRGPAKKKDDIPVPRFRTISEDEIRSRHDDLYKIRQGAKSLPRGEFTPDNEFKDGCQISPKGRSLTREREFDIYHGKAPGGDVYWGHPDSIARLKADHVLS
jgi:hypothetical protein